MDAGLESTASPVRPNLLGVSKRVCPLRSSPPSGVLLNALVRNTSQEHGLDAVACPVLEVHVEAVVGMCAGHKLQHFASGVVRQLLSTQFPLAPRLVLDILLRELVHEDHVNGIAVDPVDAAPVAGDPIQLCAAGE